MDTITHIYNNGKLKVSLSEDALPQEFAAINDLINKHDDIKYLGVDMHKCPYIQSKTLAELIALKKLSIKLKFDIALLNINENISQILEMSSLLGFFIVEDDFSFYDIDQLCNRFLDPVNAIFICDYIAANYTDEVRQKLINIVKSKDPIQTECALISMGRAQDYASVNIFREELDNPSDSVKAAAVLVLGWIGDTDSKEQIYKFLSSSNGELSDAAAGSIALLSDDTDSDKLVKYLEHEANHICKSAIQALSLINDDKGFEYIRSRIDKETDETIRITLTRSISSFNKEGVTEILIKLLDDQAIAVREAAASGIVRVGPKQYIDEILAKITDKDNWVGFFATKSLAGVCDSKVAKGLIEAYPTVEQNVKLAIIETIGNCTDDNSDFLMDRVNDENEDIRKEVLNALDKSSSTKAMKVALKLYNTDSSWIVRYKAIEMIIANKPTGYERLLKTQTGIEENRYVREKILSGIGE